MTWKIIKALLAWAGLPLKVQFKYREPDPDCPGYEVPLDLTDRTLVATVRGRAQAIAYEVEILADPPAPGIYVFELKYAGQTYTITIEVLPGWTAKDLRDALMKELAALLLPWLLFCPKSCAAVSELMVFSLFPGVFFELSIVSQPDDDVQIDQKQADDPLLTMAASAQIQGDDQVVMLSLSAEQTAALPPGDGPYDYAVIAVQGGDPTDVLFLARGTLLVERSAVTVL